MENFVFFIAVVLNLGIYNICNGQDVVNGDRYEDSLVSIFDSKDTKLREILNIQRGVIAKNGYYDILRDSSSSNKLKAFANFRLAEYYLAVNRADSAVVKFTSAKSLCDDCFSSDTSSLISLADRLNDKYFSSTDKGEMQNSIPSSTSKSGVLYSLQVGVFSSKANADRTSVRMKKIMGSSRIKDFRIGDKLFYKVLVGKFKNVTEANKIGVAFLKARNIEYRVVMY